MAVKPSPPIARRWPDVSLPLELCYCRRRAAISPRKPNARDRRSERRDTPVEKFAKRGHRIAISLPSVDNRRFTTASAKAAASLAEAERRRKGAVMKQA